MYPISKERFLELLWLAVANGWKSAKISKDKAEVAPEKLFAAYLPPSSVDATDSHGINEALKKLDDALRKESPVRGTPTEISTLMLLLKFSENGAFTIEAQ